ncbi:GNAT family N-acetyltransferase [Mycobacterium sp. 134]|uniref:GNAT family N-acetyltransferase n=1 Tax=Mycobacterium sp. 134 TaxID=3400425 RepID=UPI003AB0860E
MLGRLLTVDDVTPRFVDAWRDLAARSAEPNPCHEAGPFLAATRHLTRPPSLTIAAVGTEQRLMACLPVWRGRYWNRLPVRAIQTWQHRYSYLGAPLLDRTDPVAAAGDLLGALSRSHPGRVLVLRDCVVGGPVHAALTAAADAHGTRVHVDRAFERAIARAADPEPIALRGKHLKDLRRTRRKLETELGSPLALVHRRPDPTTVTTFLKLEASGWKGARGDALACGDEGFFREMCDGPAVEDRIGFISLESGERTVAMLCTMRTGDHWYWFKIAFDERFGASSPGRQLMLAVTAGLRDAPAATVLDSCADPRNETINQLWTARRGFATLLVALPGPLRAPTDFLARASSQRHQRKED